MRRQIMLEQWSKFAAATLPKDCPKIQKTEMRRAFYAGGHSLMFSIMESLTPGDDATQNDLTLMSDLDYELRVFAKDVLGGRA